MVTRATDLEKALEASRLGDLRWLGDPSLLPRERVGATLAPPDEPWFQAHNLAHLEAMLAAKLLAATLLAGDNDTVNPVRINEEILDWRDIAGDSASAIKLSTTEAVRAAFILLEKSLGRSARTVRDKKRQSAMDLASSDVQIYTNATDGRAKHVDWFLFARKEEIEADEAAAREMSEIGPRQSSLAQLTKTRQA